VTVQLLAQMSRQVRSHSPAQLPVHPVHPWQVSEHPPEQVSAQSAAAGFGESCIKLKPRMPRVGMMALPTVVKNPRLSTFSVLPYTVSIFFLNESSPSMGTFSFREVKAEKH